jgi:hypothetical protein
LSERIRGGESLSNEITGERLGGDAQLSSDESIVHLENVVRETSQTPCPIARSEGLSHSPAHPSNRVITQLSAKWRVVHDPLQWILQRRKGNPRKKNSGWQDRSFCTTREGLLRCVREHCGEVDDNALAQLRALPEFHNWELSR